MRHPRENLRVREIMYALLCLLVRDQSILEMRRRFVATQVDPRQDRVLSLEVILASVYLLSVGAPVEGALVNHGPNQTCRPGRTPAQPEKHQPGDSAQQPDG